MPKEIINASLNKKKKKQTKRQKLSSTKEKNTSFNVMESMEKAITHNASKGKHNTLDERTLNPRAKALLEDGRVDYFSEANYTKDSATYMWLVTKITEIAERIYKNKMSGIESNSENVPTHLV